MKNEVVAGILGFFIFGIFYSYGFNKQSVLIVLGLCVLSSVIAMTLGTTIGLIVNIACAYLSVKKVKEVNADYSNLKVDV